jgi:hypothetical protein
MWERVLYAYQMLYQMCMRLEVGPLEVGAYLRAWVQAFAYTQLVECPVYAFLLEDASAEEAPHELSAVLLHPRVRYRPILCGFAASAITHPLATCTWWAAQWWLIPCMFALFNSHASSHASSYTAVVWAVWFAIEAAVCTTEAWWLSQCRYRNGRWVAIWANAASCAAGGAAGLLGARI